MKTYFFQWVGISDQIFKSPPSGTGPSLMERGSLDPMEVVTNLRKQTNVDPTNYKEEAAHNFIASSL